MTRRPDNFYFQAKNAEAYENITAVPTSVAIKYALDAFGKVSAPYLQKKCKITFKEAIRCINDLAKVT